MENKYSWVKADRVFSVTAEYGQADCGAFYRDDPPDERWTVRPGADAVLYRLVDSGGKTFSSPEELVLYLHALAPNGFALDLQMCDREAGKFIRVWKSVQGRREGN